MRKRTKGVKVEDKPKPKRTREASVVEQAVEHAMEDVEPREILNEEDLIPSGSTLLNCACSGNPFGAFGKGKVATIPGGSSSGKTVLVFNTFAAASKLKRLKDYVPIYDDAEEALELDVEYMFNKKIANSIQPPATDGDGNPKFSNTIQDFENNIINWCKKGVPFIYVLDSLDSLTSTAELEKAYKKALQAAKSPDEREKVKGSMHTDKAKITGQVLRMCNSAIKKSGSILIIIQQEREKIGVVFGSKKTTSGGKAPFYYSTHQIWLTKIGSIKEEGLDIGSNVKVQVKKNKLTGKRREIEFDIYDDYGIDNLTSCVNFLCDHHWKKNKDKTSKWNVIEFDIVANKKQIIDYIEENNLEHKLDVVVGVAWHIREESVRLNRKRRY